MILVGFNIPNPLATPPKFGDCIEVAIADSDGPFPPGTMIMVNGTIKDSNGNVVGMFNGQVNPGQAGRFGGFNGNTNLTPGNNYTIIVSVQVTINGTTTPGGNTVTAEKDTSTCN